MNILQALIDSGINAFGAQLLAESYLRSPIAAQTQERGEPTAPLKFFIPVNRTDCPRWVGVEITLTAVQRDGEKHDA